MVKVSWKNSKFLYPLWSLSQLFFNVSEELCLDFAKTEFWQKFGWKTKILRFWNDFWVLFISSSGAHINLPNFQIPFGFSSKLISISICEQARNQARGPKTQNFKVLRFEPNFKGRLYMTSKGTPWKNFIKKHLKNRFIHDSSEVYVFPQILSLTDTISP